MNEDVISQLAYQEFVNTEQKKEIQRLREALINEIQNESTMTLDEINDYIDKQVLEVVK